MDLAVLAYSIEDIAGQLRVHLQANPLDDVVEHALEELEGILDQLNEEL